MGEEVARDIILVDVSDRQTMHSAWKWGVRDPYVVTVTFGRAVLWEFDRQILIDGIESSAGLWDVKMRRTGKKTVELVLSSPDGSITFECPRGELRDFVKAILPHVPQPRLPTDGELAAFIAGASHLKDKRFGSEL